MLFEHKCALAECAPYKIHDKNPSAPFLIPIIYQNKLFAESVKCDCTFYKPHTRLLTDTAVLVRLQTQGFRLRLQTPEQIVVPPKPYLIGSCDLWVMQMAAALVIVRNVPRWRVPRWRVRTQRLLRVPKTVFYVLVSSPRLQTVWLYRKIIRQTLGNTYMVARASWNSAVCTNNSFQQRRRRRCERGQKRGKAWRYTS